MVKIFTAQLNYTVGDLEGNTQKILAALIRARAQGTDLVVFSELALCGYPPEDLLFQEGFVEAIEKELQKIIAASQGLFVVVGLVRKNPSKEGKPFLNSAAMIENGALIGYHDKWLLPTYDVFDESRYFEPGSSCLTWTCKGKRFATLICEDIWHHAKELTLTSYVKDPVKLLSHLDIDFLINISASPYHVEKIDLRLEVCKKAAITLNCPLVLACQVGGNDQLVFDGYSLYMDETGRVQSLARGFEEEDLIFEMGSLSSTEPLKSPPLVDLQKALVLGVRDYFHKSGFQSACLGLSGGIDSAFVACLAAEALGKENLKLVFMPSRFTSEQSRIDAKQVAKNLGIYLEEISIEGPFEAYLSLLTPHFAGKEPDVTEENLQARVRGMILMALSNKLGHVVLNAGNKSEMALGYMTLYGDLCGGLGVISDLTKKQVYELARKINETSDSELIPLSILQKPPSAELKDNQKDSDSMPDYEILDEIVYQYVDEGRSYKTIAARMKLDPEFVLQVVSKIHRSEYKRRQAPPGIRVSQKSFREGRKIPIVQKWDQSHLS